MSLHFDWRVFFFCLPFSRFIVRRTGLILCNGCGGRLILARIALTELVSQHHVPTAHEA
jgi:hypothetical protein